MNPHVTEKQRKILSFLADFLDRKGFPPSHREIGDHLHSTHRAVQKHLLALEKKGVIRLSRDQARGIEMVGKPRGRTVPILGRIQAGVPIMAEQNREGELLLDPTIAGKKGVFLLRVKGDSMIGAHIQDGDLVVVEENPSPENGDIVVALIDDETTMKRFFLEEGKVRLQPENPNMPPIFIGEGKTRVGIIGKVVGLLRKY